jgi:hypothetical protein
MIRLSAPKAVFLALVAATALSAASPAFADGRWEHHGDWHGGHDRRDWHHGGDRGGGIGLGGALLGLGVGAAIGAAIAAPPPARYAPPPPAYYAPPPPVYYGG